MVVMTLTCAVFGERDSAFDVEIDDGAKVSALKEAIKAKNPVTVTCDAKNLRLFLAKKKKREKKTRKWLRGDELAAVTLDGAGEVPGMLDEDGNRQNFVWMDPTLYVKNDKHFGTGFTPGEGQVHVLVVVPEGGSAAEATRETKLTSLSMMLKQCKVVGDLPQEGAFLNLFEWTDDDCGTVVDITVIDTIVRFTSPRFYVRKEILCVLEIFMSVYRDEFDTGEVGSMQFVLMGSPGTGKSCILALLCLYIAVRYKRPVLWFRRVNGGLNQTFTRLFYKGKYYEWLDENGKKFESIYDAMEAGGIKPTESWVCLDGMTESEVEGKNWRNRYKLLATSCQFSPNSEAMQFTKRCLVPYWKRRDVEDFGLNHMQMHESDVDARYFVSGGSLRDFVGDNGKDVVKAAMANIAGPGDAEMLLTANRTSSRQQIDRIRMRGVQNVNNVEHYVDTDKWSCCVTSKFALQRLAAVMMPDFFEKLMGVAKGMNDDRLEGVAFEGYFHSLVRHRRSIRVEYCKYDNVDRRTDRDWQAIMSADVGSIELNEHPLVTCEGGNKRECVAVMESWAANPSTMSYWIPATSLCETIDAVAKWRFPDGVERFCFLQLTKAATHKCDAAILWELAQPFVNHQLQVCYIALLPTDPDEDKRRRFRLNPAVVTQQTVVDHIDLYVAHFQVMPCVNTTTS